MSQGLTSYKLEKYQRKLQSVSQNHPSYQVYLSKYMYYLQQGSGNLTQDQINQITPLLQPGNDDTPIKQILGCGPGKLVRGALAVTGAAGRVVGRATTSVRSFGSSVTNSVVNRLTTVKTFITNEYINVLDKNPLLAANIEKMDQQYTATRNKTQQGLNEFKSRVTAAIEAYKTTPGAVL
jgi:hypothetical protein